MADPTEDVVRREITRARKILQEDRHAAGLKGLSERMDRHFPDNSGKGDDTPQPPPAQPPADPEPRKGGVWWP